MVGYLEIIMSTSSSIPSYAIRFVEAVNDGRIGLADWSHCACVSSEKRDRIIDSMWQRKGVTERTRDSFEKGFPDHQVYRAYVPYPEQAYAWLQKQKGKKYDGRALYGFLLDTNIEDPDDWFCFELAAGFIHAGAPDVDFNFDLVTCDDLLHLIRLVNQKYQPSSVED